MTPDSFSTSPGHLAEVGSACPSADWLLAPIDLDDFVERFWDRKPLHIAGRGPEYYSNFYTLGDVDRALNCNGIRSPFLRLVRNGSEIPLGGLAASGYARANLLEDAFAEHRQGASIVLQFLHEQNGQLKELSRELAMALSSCVQVNAYLTPKNEQGLGTHYDTHDVFVLQIHGKKDWTLYDRTDLAPFKSERGSRTEVDDAIPRRHLTLVPGDCLYLPRGWIHKAASRDSASLHLTVGIHPLRWAQLIQGAVTDILHRHPRYRRALPPGFATNAGKRIRAEHKLRALWTLVEEEIDIAKLLEDAVAAAHRSLPPRLEGHLLDLDKVESICQDTRLKPRDIEGLSIEGDSSHVRISYHGKLMECPAALEESLYYALGTDAFSVRDLPASLTPNDKLVLARRLVQEGLLTIADEAAADGG